MLWTLRDKALSMPEGICSVGIRWCFKRPRHRCGLPRCVRPPQDMAPTMERFTHSYVQAAASPQRRSDPAIATFCAPHCIVDDTHIASLITCRPTPIWAAKGKGHHCESIMGSSTQETESARTVQRMWSYLRQRLPHVQGPRISATTTVHAVSLRASRRPPMCQACHQQRHGHPALCDHRRLGCDCRINAQHLL